MPRPPHNLSFFLSYPRGGYGDRGPKWAPFFLFKGWKSELLFVSLGMVMKETTLKTLNRNQMMAFLEKKGCKVVGTTEEFNGSQGGIWLSGEQGDGLFNYYAEGSNYEFGVLASLSEQVMDRGWYFEWNDAGTIMCWED